MKKRGRNPARSDNGTPEFSELTDPHSLFLPA